VYWKDCGIEASMGDIKHRRRTKTKTKDDDEDDDDDNDDDNDNGDICFASKLPSYSRYVFSPPLQLNPRLKQREIIIPH
jgi:hypothetical protein